MKTLNLKLEGRNIILKFEARYSLGQAKTFWEANFEAKIEARPTLRSGQANGARPGFIVCPIVQNVTFWIVARQIELSFGRLVCHEIKLHIYIKE